MLETLPSRDTHIDTAQFQLRVTAEFAFYCSYPKQRTSNNIIKPGSAYFLVAFPKTFREEEKENKNGKEKNNFSRLS